MYRIEYYTKRGMFVCARKFQTLQEAHKYARRHRERFGIHYVVLSDNKEF